MDLPPELWEKNMVFRAFSLKPIHGSKFQVTPPMAFPGCTTLGALGGPGPIHGLCEGGRGGGGGAPGGRSWARGLKG